MKPKQTSSAAVPIMDAEAIRRALRRIAHEIIERNPNLRKVVLAGIPSRGVEIARRIAAFIHEIEKTRRRDRRHRCLDASGRRGNAHGTADRAGVKTAAAAGETRQSSLSTTFFIPDAPSARPWMQSVHSDVPRESSSPS